MISMSQVLHAIFIEDVLDDCLLLVREIQRANYELIYERIETAQQLRDLLKQRKWDIIFSDYSLPNFSAPRALQVLHELQQDIPFILISGTVGEDIAVETMKAGANDFFIKSNTTRLIAAIERELRDAHIRHQQRHISDQLRHSQQRYQDLFENLPIGLYRASTDGFMLDANPALVKLLGYPDLGTLLNANAKEWATVSMDFQKWEAEMSHEGLVHNFEALLRGYDGREIWCIMNARAVQDANGQTIFFECSVQDVTTRKHAELQNMELINQLNQYTAGLEQRVAQRTQELHIALAKEKDLNELKSRFVSMVTHEFRTPLATILLSAELLQLYGERMSEEKKQQHFNKLLSQVKHLSELMEDVLTLARADAVGLMFAPTAFNLEAFFQIMIEEVQQSDHAQHIIHFNKTGEASHVWGDDKLLRHIVFNLLTNALKYSPSFSPIYVDLICDEAWATIRVRDEGIGIPAEDQVRLFEAFHRASNVGAIGGNGLGLVIVKRAVDAHGGTLHFESVVGMGTTFTVKIPIQEKITSSQPAMRV
jgi:PAS domain S-box-containing protein